MISDQEYENIPLKNLSVIWIESQRPYNEKWARQIADEFDPDKFDPICVTKPNGVGVYHIIDGQHRKSGAEMFLKDPNQKVMCRIVSEADPARAAEIFLTLNSGRKPIKPVSAFLVAVKAERETEVAINAIVKKAGYFVHDTYKTENTISAVGAMRKIYLNCGPFVLRKTLDTCRELWGSDSRGVVGPIITGLGTFMNEFGTHVDVRHLCSKINSQYRSPGNFVEAARTTKEKTSESLDVSMSELLRMKYNHGLREDKKLKRKEA